MRPIDFLAAVGVALLAGLGLFAHRGLLGLAGAEVYGHAWVQWWHGRALPAWPAGTDLAAGAKHWPVIDPLPTALGAVVGRVAGVVAGYDAVVLLSVAGAFLGGAWAARRCGGDPWTGGIGLAMAPAFVGSLQSGLTEDGAVGLAAVGLAALAGTKSRPVLAGVALGMLAGSGLVLAWAAGVAAVGLGAWLLWRDPRRWPGMLGGGALAVGLAAPVAWLQGARLSGVGHRAGRAIAQAEPLWRLNPWHGIDLLSFFAPGRQDPGAALVHTHPGYLGLVLVALAIAGGWSRWWPVLLGALLLAPGTRLSAGGQPLGLTNPFAVLAHHLPFGALLNHHGRLLLVGAVALAQLASRGAARLAARGWPRWLFPLAVGAEFLLIAPVGYPLPVADARPPDVATRLGALSPGRLLVVPAGGPGIHFQRPLFDQRVHGRPLVRSPDRPGLPPSLTRTASGRWLGGLAFVDGPPPPSRFEPPAGVAVLMALAPYDARVARVLGPPDVQGHDGAAWDLRRRKPDASAR